VDLFVSHPVAGKENTIINLWVPYKVGNFLTEKLLAFKE